MFYGVRCSGLCVAILGPAATHVPARGREVTYKWHEALMEFLGFLFMCEGRVDGLVREDRCVGSLIRGTGRRFNRGEDIRECFD